MHKEQLIFQLVTILFGVMAIRGCHGDTSCSSLSRNQSTFCNSVTCYNGNCVKHQLKADLKVFNIELCVCDNGWDGPRCEICCDLECDLGYKCKAEYDVPSSSYKTRCFWYEHEEGQSRRDIHSTLLHMRKNTRKLLKSSTGGDGHHAPYKDPENGTTYAILVTQVTNNTVNAASTQSPTNDPSMGNACKAINRKQSTFCETLMCYNGECETRGNGTVPEIPRFCRCDQGWTGASCNQCCDLPCKHGQCSVNVTNSQMYCICHKGYHDKYCDVQILQEDNSQDIYNNVSLDEFSNMSVTSFPEATNNVSGLGNTPSIAPRLCTAVPRGTSERCGHIYCYNGDCHYSESITLPGIWRTNNGVCMCDDGWHGVGCDHCCDLDCNNGDCALHPDNSMYCNCYNDYNGIYCDQKVSSTTPTIRNITVLIPKERTPFWYWYVVGTCIGFLVIFPVGMGVLIYVLWLRRNVFIMNIVRCFQSPEDEDDGRLYDACVSYTEDCSTDELFCSRQIYPKLEKEMDFKLYLQFRDALGGSARAEEIISAVEKSRRTILLISPEYLLDEWPRLQLLAATHEMLQQRHKIIPVILRDVSHIKDIDPVLGNTMKSFRCIKWPQCGDPKKEEKFWERLRLELPKKRKMDPGNIEGSPNHFSRCRFRNWFRLANVRVWRWKDCSARGHQRDTMMNYSHV